MVVWLVELLVDLLNGWMDGWLVGQFVDLLVCGCVGWLVGQLSSDLVLSPMWKTTLGKKPPSTKERAWSVGKMVDKNLTRY